MVCLDLKLAGYFSAFSFCLDCSVWGSVICILAFGGSSLPFLPHHSLVLSAAAPDHRHGVNFLGHHPMGMGSSRLLPLTSDEG